MATEPTTYTEWCARADATSFPPTSAADVMAYRHEAVMDGYCAWISGDFPPGPNHSPGFRWGWQNRQRDAQREDDGFDAIRHEAIRIMRAGAAPAEDGRHGEG